MSPTRQRLYVDPAVHEFVVFIQTTRSDITKMQAWERQFLTGYTCIHGIERSPDDMTDLESSSSQPACRRVQRIA
jgi:hypothetical protein